MLIGNASFAREVLYDHDRLMCHRAVPEMMTAKPSLDSVGSKVASA